MRVDLDFIQRYAINLRDDRDWLPKLGSISASLDAVRLGIGGKVLDVGCGHDKEWAGRDNIATPYPREFEPWLSRIAVWSGADVTGLDYSKESPRVDLGLKGGSWRYAGHDLLGVDKWPFDDHSFDVVAINALVHLENIGHASPRFNPQLPPNSEEGMTWTEKVDQYERVRRDILENVMRVIKVNGRLIFNHYCFNLSSNDGKVSTLTPEDEHTWNLAIQSPEVCTYPFEARSAVDQISTIRRHASTFDEVKRPQR